VPPARTLPSLNGAGPPPALGPGDLERLAALVREQPDATLEQLKQQGGFQCSLKTLWFALDRLGLTPKKKSLHADQRDRPDVQTKRGRFRRKVRTIESKKLVFVDETGVTTAMTPAYARAPGGRLRPCLLGEGHRDHGLGAGRGSRTVSSLIWLPTW
jgi:hypothetical protein